MATIKPVKVKKTVYSKEANPDKVKIYMQYRSGFLEIEKKSIYI